MLCRIGEDFDGIGRGLSVVLSRLCLEGLRKTTISIGIADVPSETQTRHLPSLSIGSYCYADLSGELLNLVKLFKLRAVEIRECLLSFGAESFVFQFVIQKFKD
jgi:hypothetical protein